MSIEITLHNQAGETIATKVATDGDEAPGAPLLLQYQAEVRGVATLRAYQLKTVSLDPPGCEVLAGPRVFSFGLSAEDAERLDAARRANRSVGETTQQRRDRDAASRHGDTSGLRPLGGGHRD